MYSFICACEISADFRKFPPVVIGRPVEYSVDIPSLSSQSVHTKMVFTGLVCTNGGYPKLKLPIWSVQKTLFTGLAYTNNE